jgi:hypothetical protein
MEGEGCRDEAGRRSRADYRLRTCKLRLGTPAWERSEKKLGLARLSMGFYYVYILRSEKHTEHFYAGFTEDLDVRLKAHSAGSGSSHIEIPALDHQDDDRIL